MPRGRSLLANSGGGDLEFTSSRAASAGADTEGEASLVDRPVTNWVDRHGVCAPILGALDCGYSRLMSGHALP